MSNLFTIGGFSTKQGKVKFRVANGSVEGRKRVLERDGHTNIDLIQLPTAMSKEDAEVYVRKAMNAPAAGTAKPAAKPAVTTKVTPAAPVAAKVETKPAAEVARIKEANLDTMRKVSDRLNKMREVA
jgi:translation elongation factor EF-G